MSEYVRPSLPRQVFFDAAGAVIEYGRRWRDRPAPPQSSYGIDSNPQRFAPLHLVAEALIEHLKRNYALNVKEGVAVAADLLRKPAGLLRAVRVTPVSTTEAPLTFVFTPYPGVIVHAGLLHDFPFPQCGCDACDESAESAAAEMESTVLAVVAGRFYEWVDAGAELPIGYEITDADGARRARGATIRGGIPEARLREAQDTLGRLTRGWQPWSPSAEAASSTPG